MTNTISYFFTSPFTISPIVAVPLTAEYPGIVVDTNVALAGIRSFKITFFAVCGPSLVTIISKVPWDPIFTSLVRALVSTLIFVTSGVTDTQLLLLSIITSPWIIPASAQFSIGPLIAITWAIIVIICLVFGAILTNVNSPFNGLNVELELDLNNNPAGSLSTIFRNGRLSSPMFSTSML